MQEMNPSFLEFSELARFLIPLAEDLQLKVRHPVAKLLQDFALLDVENFSSFANNCVGEKLDLLVGELGWQSEVTELDLHGVRKSSKSLNSLLELHSEGCRMSSFGKVKLLELQQSLLEVFHRLIRAQQANLADQVLNKG